MAMTVDFLVDHHHLALPLPVVVQVTRVAAITPVPRAPAVVLGVLDFHGEIVPVMDIRARLGLETRSLRLSDQLIIARTPRRRLAIVADRVLGLQAWDERDFVSARTVVPQTVFLDGVARSPQGLLLVYEPDALLGGDEIAALDEALAEHGHARH